MSVVTGSHKYYRNSQKGEKWRIVCLEAFSILMRSKQCLEGRLRLQQVKVIVRNVHFPPSSLWLSFSVLNMNFLPTLKSEGTYITSYLRKWLLIHYSCPVSYILNFVGNIFLHGVEFIEKHPFWESKISL